MVESILSRIKFNLNLFNGHRFNDVCGTEEMYPGGVNVVVFGTPKLYGKGINIGLLSEHSGSGINIGWLAAVQSTINTETSETELKPNTQEYDNEFNYKQKLREESEFHSEIYDNLTYGDSILQIVSKSTKGSGFNLSPLFALQMGRGCNVGGLISYKEGKGIGFGLISIIQGRKWYKGGILPLINLKQQDYDSDFFRDARIYRDALRYDSKREDIEKIASLQKSIWSRFGYQTEKDLAISIAKRRLEIDSRKRKNGIESKLIFI